MYYMYYSYALWKPDSVNIRTHQAHVCTVFWWMSVFSVCLTCAYCHLQEQQCCCFISRYHWVLIVSLITAALYDLHIHDALKTQQFNSTILVDLILKLNGWRIIIFKFVSLVNFEILDYFASISCLLSD